MPSLVQWKWYMGRPPVFLAVGSFLLFFAPQLIPMWGKMASAAGGILLFIGWIDLGWALFHQGNFRRAAHGFIMVYALLVSAVGFGLGLITLPMAFPQGEYLLFTWTFHYAPHRLCARGRLPRHNLLDGVEIPHQRPFTGRAGCGRSRPPGRFRRGLGPPGCHGDIPSLPVGTNLLACRFDLRGV